MGKYIWGKLLEELLAVRFPPDPFQELKKRVMRDPPRAKEQPRRCRGFHDACEIEL
jgi:hypothetical protein